MDRVAECLKIGVKYYFLAFYMKKVIYTCLVGGYDKLLQPVFIDKSFDYICFSNDIKEEKVGVWRIIPILFDDKDKTRISRYPKLLPHQVLQEYDYSLYLDANIQITGSELYNVINQKIKENVLIAQVPNIFRNCIYRDIEIAYRRRKVDFCEAKKQYKHLKQECFPERYGLLENNVILRMHNNPKVIEISKAWWKEYCTYTHRDQFCLMYIYWKYAYMPSYLFGEGENARNVKFLELRKHFRKNTFLIRTERIHEYNNKLHSLIRKYIWRLFAK